MLKIDVLSTFPEIFQSTLRVGIVGRALDKKLAEPHPSWVKEIEKQWMKRYGTIN